MTALVGLYAHVPFCSVKCYYCDFTAFSGQGRQAARYLDALEAEARLAPSRQFATLFIGGGTPSELAAPELGRLLSILNRLAPSSGFKEATCEANPDSLDQEKLAVLRQGGIDRLSLGLQTADDALLKSIGRRHTMEDFRRVYRQARETGSFAISIDLMYGLPGQDLAGFKDSLERTLELEPDHLSVYGLQVEDRTLFAKRGVEPEEGLGREMFEACLQRLYDAGYAHYEISNFARPGMQSAHNRIYWENGEYLGLGCGAASFLDGARSENADGLSEYIKTALAGRRPTASSESLQGKEALGERAYLGLRMLEGVALDAGTEKAFSRELESLAGRGLISRRGSRAALTRDGVFLYNQVAAEFVAPFSPS